MVAVGAKSGRVYRVYSADRSEWVDVLRFDEVFVDQSSVKGVGEQGAWIKLNWTDGKTENRLYEDVVVTPPSAGSQGITLKAIRSMAMYVEGQEQIWTFDNLAMANSGFRQKRVIRVYTSTATASETGTSWEDYKDGLSTQDKTESYLDVNVTDAFFQMLSGQNRDFQFVNDDIVTRFDSGDTSSIYLDPFQVIVNASLADKRDPKFLTWDCYIRGYTSYVFPAEIVDAEPQDYDWWAAALYLTSTRLTYEGATPNDAKIPTAVDVLDKNGSIIKSGHADESCFPPLYGSNFYTTYGAWQWTIAEPDLPYKQDPNNAYNYLPNPYVYSGSSLPDFPYFYSDTSIAFSLTAMVVSDRVTEHSAGPSWAFKKSILLGGSSARTAYIFAPYFTMNVGFPAVQFDGHTYNPYGLRVTKLPILALPDPFEPTATQALQWYDDPVGATWPYYTGTNSNSELFYHVEVLYKRAD